MSQRLAQGQEPPVVPNVCLIANEEPPVCSSRRQVGSWWWPLGRCESCGSLGRPSALHGLTLALSSKLDRPDFETPFEHCRTLYHHACSAATAGTSNCQKGSRILAASVRPVLAIPLT